MLQWCEKFIIMISPKPFFEVFFLGRGILSPAIWDGNINIIYLIFTNIYKLHRFFILSCICKEIYSIYIYIHILPLCHAIPMSLTMISLSLAFLSILYAPLQPTAANWHPSEGRCICWPPKGWGMKPCFLGHQKKVVSTTHDLLLLVEEFSKKDSSG